MKKTLIFVLLLALMASLFVPFSASAKDGELLIAVNFLTDTFHTENRKTAVEYNYSDKYDLSQSTSSMLFATKKEGVDTDTWNADLHYVEDTGYYVTNDTKYTIYFEAASAHYNKWSGVTFLRDPNLYNALIILMGAYSDDGDNKDADGNRWSELLYAYDYGKVDYALGSGYNSKTLMQFHPALVRVHFLLLLLYLLANID